MAANRLIASLHTGESTRGMRSFSSSLTSVRDESRDNDKSLVRSGTASSREAAQPVASGSRFTTGGAGMGSTVGAEQRRS